MLRLRVSSKINLTLECATTDLAGERLKACVFSAVGDEVGRLAKSFAALQALVWFFTWNTQTTDDMLVKGVSVTASCNNNEAEAELRRQVLHHGKDNDIHGVDRRQPCTASSHSTRDFKTGSNLIFIAMLCCF